MTNRLAALVVILASISAARAQEPYGWAHKLLVPENGQPVTEHDFGTVPKGALLQHRFHLTNIYAVPLELRAVSLCDCTTVVLSRASLQPKEAGYLDIQMDTRRFNGPKEIQVQLTVVHQPNYTSTTFLKIKSFCRTDVTLNPGELKYGIVQRGQSIAHAVDINYRGTGNFRLSEPAANELFNVEVKEISRQLSQASYRVQMTLKPDAPAGSFKRELLIPTNDSASPTVPIPFEITIQPPVAVFPQSISFNAARVGFPSEYKVTVKGNGQPIRVTSVDGLGDGLAIPEAIPTPKAEMIHRFTVRFTATSVGQLSRKLTFHTDTGVTATINVEGRAFSQ